LFFKLCLLTTNSTMEALHIPAGVLLIENGEDDVYIATQLISDVDAMLLVTAIEESTKLLIFSIEGEFTDAAVIALAGAIGNSTSLNYVALHNSRITDVGATALAKAIEKSTTLYSIDLWNNSITDVGATAFAEAIQKSKSIRYIGLSHNRITDVGAFVLVNAIIRTSSIEGVFLDNTGVTKVGHNAVYSAIIRVPYIRQLLALMCDETTRTRTSSIRSFLRHDGDHAIMTRVAWFLLDDPFFHR